jgi:hypothetical protein
MEDIMQEMDVWTCEDDECTWPLPGKRERHRLFIKKVIRKVKQFFSAITSIFGIFAIVFIIVMASHPYKESSFDKTKTDEVVMLDQLYAKRIAK